MQESNKKFLNYMEPKKEYNEINGYVIGWGLFYAVLFALAVGYLCLKLGQSVDAFAPVSILAMGMAVVLKRIDPFPEIVHIQALASSGTNILAGPMFILPAIYILRLDELPIYVMVIPIVLGGIMGVFIASIFRGYFCVEMDKAYPFPSGRAAAGVLTSSSGNQAKLMIISGALGFIYDFVYNTIGLWSEVVSTTAFAWGQTLLNKFKLSISLNTDAALLGIGYFTGLRCAAVIAAGSFFSYFVCIPVLYYFGANHTILIDGKDVLMENVHTSVVFAQYVRHIGIGILAMAGVIGLFSMSGVIVNIVKKTVRDMVAGNKGSKEQMLRTDRELSSAIIAVGMLLCIFLFGVFFHIYFANTLTQTLVAVLLVALLSFLLSVVGISSIAFTGSEPVSGMTIFLILFGGVCLRSTGLVGNQGIMALLIMACFLATVIAVAGNFTSSLKVCYITGATPEKMEKLQLLGVIFTAVASVGVLVLLNNNYGFIGNNSLNAPQANAMAAIAGPLMSGGGAPWALYMAGAFLAVILKMVGVPPLAFALGAYLPMDINTPILVGGLISYFVSNSSKDELISAARKDKGSVVASGLIAGGAIGSLVSIILHMLGIDFFMSNWNHSPGAVCMSVVLYIMLSVFIYKKAK